MPYLGLFWRVPHVGAFVLVIGRTPLAEAEFYGDCLTHPSRHAENGSAGGH